MIRFNLDVKWEVVGSRRHNMYSYVQDKELKKIMISEGSDIMNRLKMKINNQECLDVDFELVGSGAKNLITQNGNQPPDVDFNFVILSMKERYSESAIKEYIREQLNCVLQEKGLRDCSDSTSALTIKSIPAYKNVVFSIDVAIIKIEYNHWYRLIHEKHGSYESDRWYWNQGINFDEIYRKVDAIKKANGWNDFRDWYINKKNYYLSKQDYNHPSYVVYIETVNEVYKMYYDRRLL